MNLGLGFTLGGIGAAKPPPVYRQPQMVTSFGTGSGSTVTLRGQARRKGMVVLFIAWNGNGTPAPGVPAGLTVVDSRVGSGANMAGVIAFRVMQDGDPKTFTFPTATKILYAALTNADPTAPVRSLAATVQNTGSTSFTYPALARSVETRPARYLRMSGIRQTVAQVTPTGWATDTSTGSSAQNIRILSPTGGTLDASLTADTVTIASAVQGVTWSLELQGRSDVNAPVYPWARAPADGSFLAIGDSITYAADPTTNYHERAFAIGSINLARYSGYNQGHSGWTTTQLSNQGSIVQAYGPSVVVLMAGTNDPTNSIAVATSQTNLRTLIDAFNGYGCQVILGTVLPNTNNQEAHRTALNDWIRIQTDVILWDNNAIGFDPATHTSDGTHPNAAGATLLGQSLATILQGVDLIPNVPSGLLLALPQ